MWKWKIIVFVWTLDQSLWQFSPVATNLLVGPQIFKQQTINDLSRNPTLLYSYSMRWNMERRRTNSSFISNSQGEWKIVLTSKEYSRNVICLRLPSSYQMIPRDLKKSVTICPILRLQQKFWIPGCWFRPLSVIFFEIRISAPISSIVTH